MPHRVETSPGLGGDLLYSSQGPMAQHQTEPPVRDLGLASDTNNQSHQQSLWRRLIFGRDKENGGSTPSDVLSKGQSSDLDDKSGIIRRVSRKVVPGLPRAQTFKRQQSELRDKLEPVQPTPAERRAVSVDRRMLSSTAPSTTQSNPRTSAPDFPHHPLTATASVPSLPTSHIDEKMMDSIPDLDELRPECEVPHDMPHISDAISLTDGHSMTTSQYDTMIHDELERVWILNLSMHFRDKSKREKFFVTYREHETLWRRVTVSLDYRNAPENSLEMELIHTKFQRDKSAKIYEAIRESLADIQFYPTVTNLKLQTTDGRLHVHVVEDVNEIIKYPTMRMVQHMRCRRVKEREIEFDSHLSGFVYKVRVNNETLIKKEIPGPDTVDEFLYEINALNRLRSANHVIEFYGVIVDDNEDHVKGLLISYAEQGALIDVLYDGEHSIPWNTRERWARQIVNGLAEIHEAGFVQGDFTLSNIVINDEGDAKIIDINRRGCPVGWEPPETTPLIESNQRIPMYIGVKSDLFQLGMVLWALATQEDEPEAHGRPLRIGADLKVPGWYRRIVEICLSEDPRHRIQALHLLSMFPDIEEESDYGHPRASARSVDQRPSRPDNLAGEFGGNGIPEIRTVQPPSSWAYVGWGNRFSSADDPYSYPTRGRSPPSPIPSNHRGYVSSSRYGQDVSAWSDNCAALAAPPLSDIPTSEGGVDHSDAHRGAEDVAMDLVTGASKPANGDTGLRIGTRNDQAEIVKDDVESHQPHATDGTRFIPHLDNTSQTHLEAEGSAEKLVIGVSKKPNLDGDNPGKTAPDGASGDAKGEDKSSATTTPHVRDIQREAGPEASALEGSSSEKSAQPGAPEEKTRDTVVATPSTTASATADILDSDNAKLDGSVIGADHAGATAAHEVTTEVTTEVPGAATASTQHQTSTSPTTAHEVRVADALTGVGSAHDFDQLKLDTGRPGSPRDGQEIITDEDDDFGIAAFAEKLQGNATNAATAAAATAPDHDVNETQDRKAELK